MTGELWVAGRPKSVINLMPRGPRVPTSEILIRRGHFWAAWKGLEIPLPSLQGNLVAALDKLDIRILYERGRQSSLSSGERIPQTLFAHCPHEPIGRADRQVCPTHRLVGRPISLSLDQEFSV